MRVFINLSQNGVSLDARETSADVRIRREYSFGDTGYGPWEIEVSPSGIGLRPLAEHRERMAALDAVIAYAENEVLPKLVELAPDGITREVLDEFDAEVVL